MDCEMHAPRHLFSVHKATRQTRKPTLKDWKTAKRIMRYLKMSKNLKLHMDGDGHTSAMCRSNAGATPISPQARRP